MYEGSWKLQTARKKTEAHAQTKKFRNDCLIIKNNLKMEVIMKYHWLQFLLQKSLTPKYLSCFYICH